ncbi:double-strand break repair helicase AddA [Oceanomicrobium pacificus]|uniref:DNA 3'-5' helicase n=1 Tax=Oceanomicrobium pacificus TaxID=2692916 RepID=A0A6B0TLH5_9RHOB|nr:double-strand break repair helicase AddA [Oceanomicrobium pacificus]MXU64746.1 double-strand break repair helicase AddA [Oceanomicrobium pacificus]
MTRSAPDAARLAQHVAATPGRSSWVSANAGSGKTRVLTERVARLLLNGTDPRKVLCLTYTRAAAGEMQNRLYRQLGTWSMMSEDDLRAELVELGEDPRALDRDALDAARRLFAQALETPGGLKIQTIHAFCDAILRRFPLEAGLPPQFQLIDPRRKVQISDEILEAMADDPARRAIFDGMARHLSGDDPHALIAAILPHAAAFRDLPDPATVRRAFGLADGVTEDNLLRGVFDGSERALLARWQTRLLGSSTNDAKAGAKLADALGAGSDMGLLQGLEGILLTGGSAKVPFGSKAGKFPTKGLRDAHPDDTTALDALADRVERARADRLALSAVERTLCLHAFGGAFVAEYDAVKARQGLLDYDDLIARAAALLTRSDMAEWVLYRLDGGIDHILVDEAQDTSPDQWQVVQAVTADFFAGAGARDIARTIFVVGDEKQSIYSFQGADPVEFGAQRERFRAALDDIGETLQLTDLLYSFRSAPVVLDLVDRVFEGQDIAVQQAEIEHRAFHDSRPGRVELWPFVPKPDAEEEAPWFEPVDQRPRNAPERVVARAVADRIAAMLAEDTALPGAGRPVHAGDIVILVQKRRALFHDLIRELKARGIPVAGADRMRITDELAVRDILSLLRFAALPEDDLALAEALRSPLLGLDERDLFELAHGRGKRTLWRAVQDAKDRYPAAHALLRDLRDRVDFERPYDLIDRLLQHHDGRRRILARMGQVAADGLDELLNQALAYEQVEPPSLTGFLAWITSDDIEVKRLSDGAQREVRVMTVHGAKGLESKIVFLPDTAQRRASSKPAVGRLAADMPVWTMADAQSPQPLRDMEVERRDRERRESLRLLYVALTRAENWLIVCGGGMQSASAEPGWYQLVEAAMTALGAVEADPVPGIDGPVRLLETHAAGDAPAAQDTPPLGGDEHPVILPRWIDAPAPPVAGRPAPRAPSDLGGAHVIAAGGALPDPELRAAALDHGTWVHLLLETLPHDPQARTTHATAARRLLARAGVPEDRQQQVMDEALAVLADPALGAVFGPDSLPEVAVTAPLDTLGGTPILGRIDRLLVASDRVMAVDFKTNRDVPDSAAEVPDALLRQMGAYAEALGLIYPDRRVETAILWTRTATLMPLPHADVICALRKAATP